MKVVFFGTPNFAAETLQYLIENGVTISAVVSKPDRPKGRSGHPLPTPVKELILKKYPSIPLYQPEVVSALEFAPLLEAYQADLFVVVAYGEILKQHILEMPRLACINLHASLLPKYRGAAPIQCSLIHGEKESGVTIMHMVKKMDAGDMIEQVVVPITPEMTYGELEGALCEVGKKALLKVIHDFEKAVPPSKAQDTSLVTFAPKIELDGCEIKWDQSAESIHNLVRGVNPHPGAWCFVEVKGERRRLKINRSRVIAEVETELESKIPGEIIPAGKHELLVASGKGVLQILELQLEGKKVMSADEFLRGISLARLG